MRRGDVLVAVSSSGESPNILRAAEESHRLGGAVVTLSAMDPDNTLRKMGSLNFYVPASTYGMAESCHAAILHHWIDHVAGFEVDEATERHAPYRPSYVAVESA
jgi:D-sedoheptulose 7-phosphate isomerase